eukprot:SAG11_NODE_1078_length_5963_cov_5.690825_6_plen_178_part_00
MFFESLVLSQVVWGSEGWLLRPDVQRQLNGWCSRCVGRMFKTPPQHEAGARSQRISLPGVIRYRRMVWLGHLLRSHEGDLTRRAVLRFAELMLRGVVKIDGSIIMDAPAHTSVDMLIWMAGGSGTEQEQEENRAQWKKWAIEKLCLKHQERRKRRGKTAESDSAAPAFRGMTAEETA